MGNSNLSRAKSAKNDEFYTQYADIQKEINAYLEYDKDVFRDKTILLPCDDPEWSNFTKFFAQNFENFGLKKLISTSYAIDSKYELYGQIELNEDADFVKSSPNYDSSKNSKKGKIFTLTRKNKKVDYNDLEWNYLEGDGDFRSDEVKKLRDEADFIITNPPFSLFREFIAWLFEADKKFVIIGNKNCITYKEVFPLIKDNKLWVGKTPMGIDLLFRTPKNNTLLADKKEGSGYRIIDNQIYARAQAVWFTNIDHGRRHKPLELMTMADNIKHNKKINECPYPKYDNYDAIEVCVTNGIPSDYDGVMGVPISFLDKYCPEQFEIIKFRKGNNDKDLSVNGKCPYFRILIRKIL